MRTEQNICSGQYNLATLLLPRLQGVHGEGWVGDYACTPHYGYDRSWNVGYFNRHVGRREDQRRVIEPPFKSNIRLG